MKMKLNEALKVLKHAGLMVEGSMSLKDKIANAKKFNSQPSSEVADEIKRIVYASNLLPAVKQAVYKIALEHAEDRDDIEDYLDWLENGSGMDREPGLEYIATTDLCYDTPAAAELYNTLMAENPELSDLKFVFGTRATTYDSPQDHITRPIPVTGSNLCLFDGDNCVVSRILPQHGGKNPNKFEGILKRNIFKSMTKDQVIKLCKAYSDKD